MTPIAYERLQPLATRCAQATPLGPLRAYLADGHCEDGNLAYCVREAVLDGDEHAAALARDLLVLNFAERAIMLMLGWEMPELARCCDYAPKVVMDDWHAVVIHCPMCCRKANGGILREVIGAWHGDNGR